jgi:hypothetical integral membrane protein (TIGR02206 family)
MTDSPFLRTGPWDVFAPYGSLHLAALCACALLIAAIVLCARALPAGDEMRFRRVLALAALAYWAAYNVWWNWGGVDIRDGLPLHICDINGVVAPLALLTQRRVLRATLYFWTVTLTLQAFIQPALAVGPTYAVFWFFWFAHSLIAACALYDLVVLRFRPRWRDLGRALAVSALYIAVIVPVNAWLGANYGFIGNPPPAIAIPPFVAALGPWPQRAVLVVALAVAGFVIALLPWLIWRGRHAARRSP